MPEVVLAGEECDCGLGEYPHPPHEEGLRALPPVLCRLEYWDGEEWVLGHHATNLLFPRRYIKRLAANGKVGRVTLLESGVLLQDGEAERGKVDPVLARLRKRFPCTWCEAEHALPHDGMCLL